MPLTNEQIEYLNVISELTCEHCKNYTGTRDVFSSVCLITKEEIPNSGTVCDCGGFEKFEEVKNI